MTDHHRVEEVFAAAVRKPPQQRSVFLDGTCRKDAGLRGRVEALLKAHDEAGSFLLAKPGDTATLNAPLKEEPGTKIGRYKILQVIGEGGFGTVFMAEQREPIKRKVALKIIKLGMDTKQVIARFEAERQALAVMGHPNIATVLDAGATKTGRPYFVMELVSGVPITEYCDKNNLSTRERLELFVIVCNAVQHAHHKGIIHRDIKPSNVLITLHGEMPVPKVIDFGIAKATNRELTDKTLFTEFKQFIGTPEYMSPEQAQMSGLDIDTRSDIYSLGVLLYELLTGTTPFDAGWLRDLTYVEMQRIICEVEPHKPSTRVSTLGEKIAEVARRRGTDEDGLGRQLAGDLDWIAMEALEKDRTRRYETANALAADVKRHLSDEPVLASPPSTWYRCVKFAKRNKGFISAAAVAVAALLVGLSVAAVGFYQASDERDRAIRAENEAIGERDRAETARDEARASRDESEAVTRFLSDMLASVDPRALGREVRVREVLEEAGEKIGTDFSDRPLLEARLRHTIGTAYHALGKYDAAEVQLALAVEIRRRELGGEHAETLRSLSKLGVLYTDQGKYGKAEPLLVETLAIKRRTLGHEHPDTVNSMVALATLHEEQDRHEPAEHLYVDALEISKRVQGEDHPATARIMNRLGLLYADRGRVKEAEGLLVESLQMSRRATGEGGLDSLYAAHRLAELYRRQKRYDEALALHAATTNACRRALGDEHPAIASCLAAQSLVLMDQMKYAEAEGVLRECLQIREKTIPNHWRRYGAMLMLAGALEGQDEFEEAEQLLLDAYEGIEGSAREDLRREALARVIKLYEAWGKLDLAAQWRARDVVAP